MVGGSFQLRIRLTGPFCHAPQGRKGFETNAVKLRHKSLKSIYYNYVGWVSDSVTQQRSGVPF